MTAYFCMLFGGVLAVLGATWWLLEHGIDQIAAWLRPEEPQ